MSRSSASAASPPPPVEDENPEQPSSSKRKPSKSRKKKDYYYFDANTAENRVPMTTAQKLTLRRRIFEFNHWGICDIADIITSHEPGRRIEGRTTEALYAHFDTLTLATLREIETYIAVTPRPKKRKKDYREPENPLVELINGHRPPLIRSSSTPPDGRDDPSARATSTERTRPPKKVNFYFNRDEPDNNVELNESEMDSLCRRIEEFSHFGIRDMMKIITKAGEGADISLAKNTAECLLDHIDKLSPATLREIDNYIYVTHNKRKRSYYLRNGRSASNPPGGRERSASVVSDAGEEFTFGGTKYFFDRMDPANNVALTQEEKVALHDEMHKFAHQGIIDMTFIITKHEPKIRISSISSTALTKDFSGMKPVTHHELKAYINATPFPLKRKPEFRPKKAPKQKGANNTTAEQPANENPTEEREDAAPPADNDNPMPDAPNQPGDVAAAPPPVVQEPIVPPVVPKKSLLKRTRRRSPTELLPVLKGDETDLELPMKKRKSVVRFRFPFSPTRGRRMMSPPPPERDDMEEDTSKDGEEVEQTAPDSTTSESDVDMAADAPLDTESPITASGNDNSNHGDDGKAAPEERRSTTPEIAVDMYLGDDDQEVLDAESPMDVSADNENHDEDAKEATTEEVHQILSEMDAEHSFDDGRDFDNPDVDFPYDNSYDNEEVTQESPEEPRRLPSETADDSSFDDAQEFRAKHCPVEDNASPHDISFDGTEKVENASPMDVYGDDSNHDEEVKQATPKERSRTTSEASNDSLYDFPALSSSEDEDEIDGEVEKEAAEDENKVNDEEVVESVLYDFPVLSSSEDDNEIDDAEVEKAAEDENEVDDEEIEEAAEKPDNDTSFDDEQNFENASLNAAFRDGDSYDNENAKDAPEESNSLPSETADDVSFDDAQVFPVKERLVEDNASPHDISFDATEKVKNASPMDVSGDDSNHDEEVKQATPKERSRTTSEARLDYLYDFPVLSSSEDESEIDDEEVEKAAEDKDEVDDEEVAEEAAEGDTEVDDKDVKEAAEKPDNDTSFDDARNFKSTSPNVAFRDGDSYDNEVVKDAEPEESPHLPSETADDSSSDDAQEFCAKECPVEDNVSSHSNATSNATAKYLDYEFFMECDEYFHENEQAAPARSRTASLTAYDVTLDVPLDSPETEPENTPPPDDNWNDGEGVNASPSEETCISSATEDDTSFGATHFTESEIAAYRSYYPFYGDEGVNASPSEETCISSATNDDTSFGVTHFTESEIAAYGRYYPFYGGFSQAEESCYTTSGTADGVSFYDAQEYHDNDYRIILVSDEASPHVELTPDDVPQYFEEKYPEDVTEENIWSQNDGFNEAAPAESRTFAELDVPIDDAEKLLETEPGTSTLGDYNLNDGEDVDQAAPGKRLRNPSEAGRDSTVNLFSSEDKKSDDEEVEEVQKPHCTTPKSDVDMSIDDADKLLETEPGDYNLNDGKDVEQAAPGECLRSPSEASVDSTVILSSSENENESGAEEIEGEPSEDKNESDIEEVEEPHCTTPESDVGVSVDDMEEDTLKDDQGVGQSAPEKHDSTTSESDVDMSVDDPLETESPITASGKDSSSHPEEVNAAPESSIIAESDVDLSIDESLETEDPITASGNGSSKHGEDVKAAPEERRSTTPEIVVDVYLGDDDQEVLDNESPMDVSADDENHDDDVVEAPAEEPRQISSELNVERSFDGARNYEYIAPRYDDMYAFERDEQVVPEERRSTTPDPDDDKGFIGGGNATPESDDDMPVDDVVVTEARNVVVGFEDLSLVNYFNDDPEHYLDDASPMNLSDNDPSDDEEAAPGHRSRTTSVRSYDSLLDSPRQRFIASYGEMDSDDESEASGDSTVSPSSSEDENDSNDEEVEEEAAEDENEVDDEEVIQAAPEDRSLTTAETGDVVSFNAERKVVPLVDYPSDDPEEYLDDASPMDDFDDDPNDDEEAPSGHRSRTTSVRSYDSLLDSPRRRFIASYGEIDTDDESEASGDSTVSPSSSEDENDSDDSDDSDDQAAPEDRSCTIAETGDFVYSEDAHKALPLVDYPSDDDSEDDNQNHSETGEQPEPGTSETGDGVSFDDTHEFPENKSPIEVAPEERRSTTPEIVVDMYLGDDDQEVFDNESPMDVSADYQNHDDDVVEVPAEELRHVSSEMNVERSFNGARDFEYTAPLSPMDVSGDASNHDEEIKQAVPKERIRTTSEASNDSLYDFPALSSSEDEDETKAFGTEVMTVDVAEPVETKVQMSSSGSGNLNHDNEVTPAEPEESRPTTSESGVATSVDTTENVLGTEPPLDATGDDNEEEAQAASRTSSATAFDLIFGGMTGALGSASLTSIPEDANSNLDEEARQAAPGELPRISSSTEAYIDAQVQEFIENDCDLTDAEAASSNDGVQVEEAAPEESLPTFSNIDLEVVGEFLQEQHLKPAESEAAHVVESTPKQDAEVAVIEQSLRESMDRLTISGGQEPLKQSENAKPTPSSSQKQNAVAEPTPSSSRKRKAVAVFAEPTPSSSRTEPTPSSSRKRKAEAKPTPSSSRKRTADAEPTPSSSRKRKADAVVMNVLPKKKNKKKTKPKKPVYDHQDDMHEILEDCYPPEPLGYDNPDGVIAHKVGRHGLTYVYDGNNVIAVITTLDEWGQPNTWRKELTLKKLNARQRNWSDEE